MKNQIKANTLFLLIMIVLVFITITCENEAQLPEQPVYYSVTFDSDGGSTIPAQLVQSGKTAVEPRSPTKAGFTFSDWYNGDNIYDFSIPITADIILKARWLSNAITNFTITFDSDGGSTVKNQIVEVGKTAVEPKSPTKAGYTFSDWYNGDNIYDFSTPMIADITLKARWISNTITHFTVTFDSSGGSTVKNQIVEIGKTAVEPKSPIKAGYTFSDWYNGNTIFDFSTPITTDIALTAKWTIETSPGEGDSTGGETGGNVATGGDSTGGETGGNVAPEGILYVTIVTSEGTYMQYEHPSIQTPYLLTEVDFGKIPLGTESQTTTFYITIIRATILNQSETPILNLTGEPPIQISGNDANQFEITQPSSKSVNSGVYIQDACITFKPTSIGQKTAIITIPNDSSDKPNFTFTIKGTGSNFPKIFDGGEGNGRDVVTKILTDSSNNMYAIGYGWELANNHSGFDWWIKKFDTTGVELWEKIFDFYDDNQFSSPEYDEPKYAIFDKMGNLLIASDYNTVKLNNSGIKLWELRRGGELFCDYGNNIIIGDTKYNSSGTPLWINNLLTEPVFDSSDNIYCVSGDIVQKINSNGSNNWRNASVDSTGRYNGIIKDKNNQTYGIYSYPDSYPVTAHIGYSVVTGKKYLLTWDDRNGTTLNSKTGWPRVSANYETTGTSVLQDETCGYGALSKKITASSTENIIVHIEPYGYGSCSGSYAIAMYQTYETGSDFALSDWINGTLTRDSSTTYSLNVVKGRPYVICIEDGTSQNGTKTGHIKVSVSYSDGTSIFSNRRSNYNSAELFFATETGVVTILVETVSSSASDAGTFGLALKELPFVQPKIPGFNTGISNAISMCLDSSDNIYVAGYDTNRANSYSQKDIVIKKFSPDGIEITSGWDKVIDYGNCNNEIPMKLIYDGSNIIMIGTGYDSISSSSENDGLFYIYYPTGSLKDSFEIPFWSDVYIRNCNYVGKDASGYYFTGYDSKECLFKYNLSGTLLWTIKHNINSSVAALDSNGSIYVGGYSWNLYSSNSNYDWYIKKYSLEGNEL